MSRDCASQIAEYAFEIGRCLLKVRNKYYKRKITYEINTEINLNIYVAYIYIYRGADKSLARPGRKQANVSVRMT